MPDDWRDVVKKITDDWSDNLEDLMVKHSEAEFLKHAASTGVNFNLIQTEALKKLVLEDVGFVAQTNKKIGQSIIDDIEKLLITKGDWASAKDAVLEHVDNVFSGQEKIVIDNIGKQAKRAVLDAELGHVVLKDFTVKRKWTGNVDAYSDMVAKSLSQKARTMGDLEGYRTTTGIIGWRRMSSLGGRTCELCASLHGRAYYFAGEGVDTLPSDDGLMFEPHPNGFCYQAPIYEEWTGLKNLNEIELDDHLARWKIDTKSPIKNLKRVPDKYGRIESQFTMSIEDAEKWASGSVYKKSVYHGTSVTNAEGIKAGGFAESKIGTNMGNAGLYGRGHYFGIKRESSLPYSRAEGNVLLEIKVNLKNICDAAKWKELDKKHGLMDLFVDDPMTGPTAVRDILQKEGFDAVMIEYKHKVGGELVIFDSSNIMVIV